MGHALTAYLGQLQNAEYIYQANGMLAIKLIAQRAMMESARGLSARFQFPLEKLAEHIDDLLLRFGNAALGDTIARVGRDTKRKLNVGDRFAGALQLCEETDMGCAYIALGAAAGLFVNSDDEGTAYVSELLQKKGLDAVLAGHMGLNADSKSYKYISSYYELLKNGADLDTLLAKAEAFTKERLQVRGVI